MEEKKVSIDMHKKLESGSGSARASARLDADWSVLAPDSMQIGLCVARLDPDLSVRVFVCEIHWNFWQRRIYCLFIT
jgi:hypothetical protein